MSSKTKIVVLHMRELIYTALFAVLGIILIIILIYMFNSDSDKENNKSTSKYTAGVYTSTVSLNNHSVDVEVVVDENNINSISLKNLDETITTMYPLMETTLDEISEQIYKNQSLNDISIPDSSQYTSTILIDAIESALDKAK